MVTLPVGRAGPLSPRRSGGTVGYLVFGINRVGEFRVTQGGLGELGERPEKESPIPLVGLGGKVDWKL